jgi:radical SAM superfamily enzyme YgiQ (UPF0313 family)
MTSKLRRNAKTSDPAEIGTIRKSWRGRFTVALVYPNTYHVGMSNLGFQTLYRLFNASERVVCERVFLPDAAQSRSDRIISRESQRPLADFDLVAFSISFENDYPNVLTLLEKAGFPLLACQRPMPLPLTLAGGVTCFLNPEPMAPFFDAFLIGEAEGILPTLIDQIDALLAAGHDSREAQLHILSGNVPGAYVPAFYTPSYGPDGYLAAFSPQAHAPDRIRAVHPPDISQVSTCSAILCNDTAFDATYLIEVSRGCPHGCRFCSAGFVYRPPRFRPLALLQADIQAGSRQTDTIGLVGAAVSDLPDIETLCTGPWADKLTISFSSLRADALTPGLLAALKKSRIKTATIAPDAGSQRMRAVINKGIEEEQILQAAETLVAGGIPNLKLYFMVGLPTEEKEDVEEIVSLCKRIKHRFLQTSRTRGHIGEITVSLNSFVPKPFTPFQWSAMDEEAVLKQKIKRVKDGLKKVANVRVHADVPRWAYIQALLSRGDRRVAQILLLAHQSSGNWSQTLKNSSINPDFYVQRERSKDELLPWDFIDHGLKKSFLWKEYQRAIAAKSSPPCPLDPARCQICGVCAPAIA